MTSIQTDVEYAISQLKRIVADSGQVSVYDTAQRALDALERVQDALQADQEPCQQGCPCSMCLETVE